MYKLPANMAVLDFETVDKYIGLGLGGGWVYGDLKIVSCAFYDIDKDKMTYLKGKSKIKEKLESYRGYICHNAQYDVGILKMVGVDISDHLIIDTQILSKLYRNELRSHSLAALSKLYLADNKSNQPLGAVAESLGLVKSKAQDSIRIAMQNMDLIEKEAPELVKEYNIHDVELTYRLAKFFLREINEEMVEKYSKYIKALLAMRERGVRIDIQRALEVQAKMALRLIELRREIYNIAGGEFSINSPFEKAEVFDRLGITYPVTTPTDPNKTPQPSFVNSWLKSQTHPICKALIKYNQYRKCKADFVDKPLEAQEVILRKSKDKIPEELYGRLYPEIMILGATRTGRVSSQGPNIQQIPKKHPELGPLIRSIFIPEVGETWYRLDFSSQEPRLQIHYALGLDAPGAENLQQELIANPKFDLHQKVADLVGISREDAKIMNLGLSYCMGLVKLAKLLGTTESAARDRKKQYNQKSPYLDTLRRAVERRMKRIGYVTTVSGRKIYNEPGFEYKAINKLIQGSAADQLMEAIIQAWEKGITILFPVHDELDASLKTYEECVILKEIMENAVQLRVPSLTEIEEGNSWGTLSLTKERYSR